MQLPGEQDEHLAFRRFIVFTVGAIVLSLSGVFLGMALRNDELIRQTLLARARSLFQEIVLERKWNASYGGVYVFKAPGVESNPWLKKPDLEAADGRTFTLRNPALMTREVSEIAAREANFRFHITSLKPLNPGNAPDPFERAALESFEQGRRETWERVPEGGSVVYRYMGALMTEEACLQCHADQGYRTGEVRGGISVSFDVSEISRVQRQNIIAVAISGGIVIGGLIFIILRIIRGLQRRLIQARAELRDAAIRDGLTGVYNRRYALSRLEEEFAQSRRTGTPLSCALLDVDNFKRVNDELGHLVGDAALVSICKVMSGDMRPYDLLGRYGGEEFILVFPASDGGAALAACQRICADIARQVPSLANHPSREFTVSIGVASLEAGDQNLEPLLGRADRALYLAKSAGKNRALLA